ncbi:transcriptional regulator family: Fungal Specific TF [Penicillium roqueforti]|nr:transcriptional regulator family: Fungal Specific TF [Penicillium roqueforti]KAI2734715.1 transcriptional regulator family: Fungal Specific TF [Penicillium roqueforti]KAI2739888.1 transcriptional regulator family: Fungal Specific TF [Penicillium roqueforti]KAI2766291.1 transcriptional regulator family: Fungal Specific TF [Penicillium roqueforti]KAI3143508.1 transcriptional regulator family: Fungal Specific TF [Penicillium roqueforti]
MSSLRKSACHSCVAAKRRCDKSFPTCLRCRQKSLNCQYSYPPNTPSTQPEEPEQLPELQSGPDNALASSQCDDGLIITPEASSDWDQQFNHELLFLDNAGRDEFIQSIPSEDPTPLQKRVLEFWPRVDDIQTWNFCTRTFLSYIDMFVRHGSNSFIQQVQQPRLRTAFAVCAAYKARTDTNQRVVQQLIDTEVKMLATDARRCSFVEKLATLQALLLYYTLMLFSGDIHLQFLAEKQEPLLGQWTAELKDPDSPAVYDTAESWELYESARRTVVLSYLLRGVYHVLKYKTCHLINDLVSLPVSLRPQVGWHMRESQSLQAGPNSAHVVSYHEFVTEWEVGHMSNLDDFGQLLLVACKGMGPVRQRNPTNHSSGSNAH